jgi:hypothetical protein
LQRRAQHSFSVCIIVYRQAHHPFRAFSNFLGSPSLGIEQNPSNLPISDQYLALPAFFSLKLRITSLRLGHRQETVALDEGRSSHCRLHFLSPIIICGLIMAESPPGLHNSPADGISGASPALDDPAPDHYQPAIESDSFVIDALS